MNARGVAEPERPFCFHYSQGHCEIVTYGVLRNRSHGVASRLVALGYAPGDVAMLFLEHAPTMYEAFVGCMLSGMVPSFMPFPNPKQDPVLFWKSHRELLDRVKPRVLIVSAALRGAFVDNLPEHADKLLSLEELGWDGAPRTVANLTSDPAFLQHSSGTTSTKKGVMLSHAQVLAQIESYSRAICLTENDVIASWLPLYHDMGLVACFLLALTSGAALVSLNPFEWVGNPSSLLEAIETHRATLCWLPNFAFNHMAASIRRGRRFDLSSLRAFINCSEPCKPRSFETFLARFAETGLRPEQLQVCYALAENVFAVSQTDFSKPPRVVGADREPWETQGLVLPGDSLGFLSCGRPIDGVEVQIVDETGNVLGERRAGEIWLRSPFLFSGYHGLPEKTELALRDGWCHSGDIGFLESGELFVTGRRDDLLIAFGRNYYAHDIEAIANGVDGLIPGRNVAFSIASERTGTQRIILAAETERSDDRTLVRRVKEAVSAASGLVLYDVFLCEPGWLVKTTSGKISRKANLSRYLERKGSHEF